MGIDDDGILLQSLTRASRRIDKHCNQRRFYPWLSTRNYNYQDSRNLILDEDLLAVTTLTAGGTTISASDYYLYPLNDTPKWKIEIDSSKSTIFDYTSTPQSAVSVNGTWGYHDDWSNAWLDSGDTVEDDPLTAAATTITVNDADGVDVNGVTPRFSIGQLLKIESEHVVVTDLNLSTNILTVRRGVNGTTAASHDQDTAISVYQPPENVTQATLALAKLYYEGKSAVGGIIALPTLEGGALRAEVVGLLNDHNLPVRLDYVTEFV